MRAIGFGQNTPVARILAQTGIGPLMTAMTPALALQVARSHLLRSEFDAAERLCRRVLELAPDQGRAWYLMGALAFERGDALSAVESLARAIELEPSEQEYYGYLKLVMAESGREQEALQVEARARREKEFTARFGQLPREIQGYQRFVDSLRETRYLQYPREVVIETIALCNAACSFCPYPVLDRKGEKMPDELIAKIIGDLTDVPRDLPIWISPFKLSDPLLDVRLLDILADINHRLPNARLRLFTNGSPLTEKKLAGIARVKQLEHLWISLNHHEKQGYEQIMKLPWERSLERLDMVHRKKASGEFPLPVIVSRVGDGGDEDAAFLRFVRGRFPLFQAALVSRTEWLGQLPGLTAAGKINPVGCARWFELSIMATGLVAFCCMDAQGRYPIGDVRSSHVLEVYNAPTYRMYRERIDTRMEAMPCRMCSNL